MTYADMFSKVKGLFMESDVSDISEHLAFQFAVVGELFYAVGAAAHGQFAERVKIKIGRASCRERV